MDFAMLWLGLFATGAAIASAVFAFVQARSATDSRRDAEDARNEARLARDESERLAGEANEAFKRQAVAQEESNRLKLLEMQPRVWTGPRWISGDLYAVTNTSGRTIRVDSFNVEPDGAEKFFRLQGPDDGVYAFGDSFEFLNSKAMNLRVRKLTVAYRFENEDDLREFIIPM